MFLKTKSINFVEKKVEENYSLEGQWQTQKLCNVPGMGADLIHWDPEYLAGLLVLFNLLCSQKGF